MFKRQVLLMIKLNKNIICKLDMHIAEMNAFRNSDINLFLLHSILDVINRYLRCYKYKEAANTRSVSPIPFAA